MKSSYDKYYQTEHLFGEPYPALIQFLSAYPNKGTLLDLGCGQGRDAIALARLGYKVLGIDNSKVGINQMNAIAKEENLALQGEVADIYTYNRIGEFDVILLDSMFHFAKRDKEKEIALLQKIGADLKAGAICIVCIQDTGDKVQTLNRVLDHVNSLKRLANESFDYVFEDAESGHKSSMKYQMIVIEKMHL